MRKLNVGDVVSVLFHGDKVVGNESFIEKDLQVTFKDAENIEFNNGDVTLYFWKRRWRYGTSAEIASLI